ncbi:MAG: hypothetical protein H0W07_05700 [Chloroflexi bacterium]|nr:hypothetical protein [Chloroflexota bacterium]
MTISTPPGIDGMWIAELKGCEAGKSDADVGRFVAVFDELAGDLVRGAA